jgi:hypothetical protein
MSILHRECSSDVRASHLYSYKTFADTAAVVDSTIRDRNSSRASAEDLEIKVYGHGSITYRYFANPHGRMIMTREIEKLKHEILRGAGR